MSRKRGVITPWRQACGVQWRFPEERQPSSWPCGYFSSLSPLPHSPYMVAMCQPSLVFHWEPLFHSRGSHHPKKLTRSLNPNHWSLTWKTLSSQFPYGFLLLALQVSVQELNFCWDVFLSCWYYSLKTCTPYLYPCTTDPHRTHQYLCLNLNTQHGNCVISTSFTVLPIAWYWKWVLVITKSHTSISRSPIYVYEIKKKRTIKQCLWFSQTCFVLLVSSPLNILFHLLKYSFPFSIFCQVHLHTLILPKTQKICGVPQCATVSQWNQSLKESTTLL